MTERRLPLGGGMEVRGRIQSMDRAGGPYVADRGQVMEADDPEAQVLTSRIADDPEERHYILIDLDVEAELIPSSTPGHSHLYIKHPVTFNQYVALLARLAAMGVVEVGYAHATAERGWGSLRLPWVKKKPPEPPASSANPWADELRDERQALRMAAMFAMAAISPKNLIAGLGVA